jgi:thiamine-phosphate pyrophosphorylase
MLQRRAVLRLLDANANRAMEGLRVCEDVIRFHLEAAGLYRRTRAVRHGIAAAVRKLPVSPVELVRARESVRDIGRRAAAGRTASLERVLLVNFQRTKEALRTLEECARLIAPKQSPAFQQLRFRTYDLERDTLIRLAAVRHR